MKRLVFWESLSASQFSETSSACKLNICRVLSPWQSGSPLQRVLCLLQHGFIFWDHLVLPQQKLSICQSTVVFTREGDGSLKVEKEQTMSLSSRSEVSTFWFAVLHSYTCSNFYYISKCSFIHYLKLHKLPKDTIFSSLRVQYTLSVFTLACAIYLYD